MAAAIGAGLPIHEPMGNMVVDIGGGTTEVAVISLGGVVALEAVRVGSFDIDAAIQTYVRREYGIAIGERTAEEIKLAIGSASAVDDEFKAEVRGRDLMSGLPKTILLVPEEVRAAIEEQVACDLRRGHRLPVADAARARAGPDPQRRPPRRGRRHAARARSTVVEETDLPVHLVDAPLECVVLGAGRCLENFDSLQRDVHGAVSRPLTDSRPHRSRSVRVVVEEVLGGLADLPVGILQRAAQRGFDLGAVERGEREDGAPADRGLVGAAGQDGREPGGVARRAERGDRRFAHQCVLVRTRGRDERRHRRAASSPRSPERERRGLRDPRVGVVQQDQQRLDRNGAADRGCCLRGSPADDRIGILGRDEPRRTRDRDRAAPHERGQCGGADPSVGVVVDQPAQPVDVGRHQFAGTERGGSSRACERLR